MPSALTIHAVVRAWASIVRTSRRTSLRSSRVLEMSRRALISEPPERELTTSVDISTRTSRAGSRSFIASIASSSEAPKRTAELSRLISVLAGSSISPSATTQAVLMLSPAFVALASTRASSGICCTKRSRRRSRDHRTQKRSSSRPLSRPTTPNTGASTCPSTQGTTRLITTTAPKISTGERLIPAETRLRSSDRPTRVCAKRASSAARRARGASSLTVPARVLT